MQGFSSEYCEILVAVSETGTKSPDDNKLITKSNLRYEQQKQTTTNCRYKVIRQQK